MDVSSSPLPPARASIGRWSFDRYIDVLRWWAGAAGGLVLLLTLFSVDHNAILGLELVFFLALGWMVTKRHAERTEAIACGAMTGAALGGIAGLGRFVIMPTTMNAINIVSELLLTGLAAALLTVSAYLMTKLFTHQP